MADATIKSFAAQIWVSPTSCCRSWSRPVSVKGVEDSISDEAKLDPADYLRNHHGPGGPARRARSRSSASPSEANCRAGRHRPARTVNVEVRKKRTYIKRDPGRGGRPPAAGGGSTGGRGRDRRRGAGRRGSAGAAVGETPRGRGKRRQARGSPAQGRPASGARRRRSRRARRPEQAAPKNRKRGGPRASAAELHMADHGRKAARRRPKAGGAASVPRCDQHAAASTPFERRPRPWCARC
jgi:translation initiation factor IF-2